MIARLALALLVLTLAACGTRAPRRPAEPTASRPEATKPPAYVLKRGGGFYQDDGPGDSIPDNLDAIPDAVPRAEPPHRAANRPYSVLGRDYVPIKPGVPYRATGIASWYGKKFHGQKTSIGETYDMYAMTAAHPTLSIPSYARVTNPANGRSVVVRVNDRGPFLHGRLIDLSYAAAAKLGYIGTGSTKVVVESIVPGRDLPPAPAPDDEDPLRNIATADPAPAPLPEIADARGIYLQLGAFSNAENADNLKLRLARELDDHLRSRLVIRSGGGYYRVQLGPWASHDEARRAAGRLDELIDAEPVVVQR